MMIHSPDSQDDSDGSAIACSHTLQETTCELGFRNAPYARRRKHNSLIAPPNQLLSTALSIRQRDDHHVFKKLAVLLTRHSNVEMHRPPAVPRSNAGTTRELSHDHVLVMRSTCRSLSVRTRAGGVGLPCSTEQQRENPSCLAASSAIQPSRNSKDDHATCFRSMKLRTRPLNKHLLCLAGLAVKLGPLNPPSTLTSMSGQSQTKLGSTCW